MAVLTEIEAKQYLSAQGLDTPDAVLAAWLELIDEKELCLGTGAGAKLAAFALLSLFALGTVYRYISSQSAPSGASRSFTIRDFRSAWKANIGTIKLHDKNGCLSDLIPADPEAKGAAIFTARGGCHE